MNKSPQTSSSAKFELVRVLEALESGDENQINSLQIQNNDLTQNVALALKSIEAVSRSFFKTENIALTPKYTSILTSYATSSGILNDKSSIEIISYNQDEQISNSALNILRDGIKNKKGFRKFLCGRGGILGRSASVLAPQQSLSNTASFTNTSSSLGQILPIRILLNIIELLIELAKDGVRSWDQSETEELMSSLYIIIEGDKDKDNENQDYKKSKQKIKSSNIENEEDNEDEDDDELKLKNNSQFLHQFLQSKGFKRQCRISEEEKQSFEERAKKSEEKMKVAETKAEQAERSYRELENSLNNRNNLLKTLIHESELEKLRKISWSEIAKELRISFGLNEEENKIIRLRIEKMCSLIIELFKDKRNDEGRIRGIDCGITEALTNNFQKFELEEQISSTQSGAFFQFTCPTNNGISLLIFAKNPFPGLIRLFDHSDHQVVHDAIASIHNIILGATKTTPETTIHPHFANIQSCGGIEKIFSLFQRFVSKYSKDTAALCLGQLFRAQELIIGSKPAKQEIISYLKKLSQDEDQWLVKTAYSRLRNLSKNEANKAEIEKDGFQIQE